MLIKIIEDFGAAEGWQVGDIVDMTDAETLIREGKVELYSSKVKSGTVAEVLEEIEAEKAAVEETEQVEGFACDLCDFVAKNKGGLTRHRNAKHG